MFLFFIQTFQHSFVYVSMYAYVCLLTHKGQARSIDAHMYVHICKDVCISIQLESSACVGPSSSQLNRQRADDGPIIQAAWVYVRTYIFCKLVTILIFIFFKFIFVCFFFYHSTTDNNQSFVQYRYGGTRRWHGYINMQCYWNSTPKCHVVSTIS